jgi:hypothetical protein
MARPKVLVDSGFLYVLFTKSDPDHPAARKLVQTLQTDFIIPQVVVTEAAWLFNRAGGMPLVASFVDVLSASDMPLEPITYDDLRRASEVMRQYPGTKLDLVDCCILAISERLGVNDVATLDRRDFSIMRRRDGRYLNVLP